MSDTPETDSVRIDRIDITMRDGGHLYVDGGMVSVEHARKLERERDYLRIANKRLNRRLTKAEGLIEAAGIVENRQKTNSGSLGRALANYAAYQYKEERDKARELARKLYWAGWNLKRFVTAYIHNYQEADGKEGAQAAELEFYEASKNLASIVGEEEN